MTHSKASTKSLNNNLPDKTETMQISNCKFHLPDPGVDYKMFRTRKGK